MFKTLNRVVKRTFTKTFSNYKVERLINKRGNEMWRIGYGYNEYRKFLRIDWGNRGWRFTRTIDYYMDYSINIYPSLTVIGQRSCDEKMFKLNDEQKNNPDIKVHDVTYCGMVVSERVDLWEKLWCYAKAQPSQK